MKGSYLLLLAVILLCSFAGCGPSKEDVVMPPTRIGTDGWSLIELTRPYSVEEAYQEADVVAHIKVGNWLGDTGDDEHVADLTYFEATAVKTYKGKISESFVLIQDGTSRVTVRGFPLFTYGDELLVFLKKAVPFEDPNITFWDNSYWIIGSYSTYLDVAYDQAGNIYYVDRGRSLGDRTTSLPRYNSNIELALALRDEMASRDPLYADSTLYHIYAEPDVERLFMSLGE